MKDVLCITGGAQGLGRELVINFCDDYEIIILDKDEKTLPVMAEKIGCDYQICDVTDHEAVKDAVEKIIKKYKKIDILINCAGIYIDGEIESNDPVLMKKVVEVNVLGPMNMCKYIVPVMKKHKSGTIININSTAGLHPKAFNSVYHASKWALTGFTESLQSELSPSSIKVVDIHPGLMKTKFTHGTNCDLTKAMDVSHVVKAIEFILSCPNNIAIPQMVIKHI